MPSMSRRKPCPAPLASIRTWPGQPGKSLRLADRLGGHLVSGHVDGVGEVLRFDPVGDNRLLEIRAPQEALARYIARKGSITVNGTSLTTNGQRRHLHHQPDPAYAGKHHLESLKPGSRVNLEVDLIARYCERLLGQILSKKLPSLSGWQLSRSTRSVSMPSMSMMSTRISSGRSASLTAPIRHLFRWLILPASMK
jgi:hypothetical protein